LKRGTKVIFIGDLHLPDETLDYNEDPEDPKERVISHDISLEAFKLFCDYIFGIVLANPEAKISEIMVVLLGDIFELRSTTRWVASDYDSNGKING